MNAHIHNHIVVLAVVLLNILGILLRPCWIIQISSRLVASTICGCSPRSSCLRTAGWVLIS
jgi:hypothetical protein